MDEDVEMVDADGAKGKKTKRKAESKLGHEFKAKVNAYWCEQTCEKFELIVLLFSDRELAGIPKREALTHTPTCHCLKLRKNLVGAVRAGSVSLRSAECVCTYRTRVLG
jgi:hypothetical protein